MMDDNEVSNGNQNNDSNDVNVSAMENEIFKDIKIQLNDFINKGIEYNYEYMNDELGRCKLVLSVMMASDNIEKEWDMSPTGEETGAIMFNKADFINMYKKTTGLEADLDKVNEFLTIENDKVYGYYVTGPSLYMIKLNEITSNGNEYLLKIDYSSESNYDAENYESFYNEINRYEETNTFNDEYITGVINIKVEKNVDNTYKFNSLVFIEK